MSPEIKKKRPIRAKENADTSAYEWFENADKILNSVKNSKLLESKDFKTWMKFTDHILNMHGRMDVDLIIVAGAYLNSASPTWPKFLMFLTSMILLFQ